MLQFMRKILEKFNSSLRKKKFIQITTQILFGVILWIIVDILIYSKINRIEIVNNNISDKIRYTEEMANETSANSAILDKNYAFQEKDIDDIISIKEGQFIQDALRNYGFETQEISKIANSLGKYARFIAPNQDIFINYDYHGRYAKKQILDGKKIDILFPKMHILEEKYILNSMEIRINKSEQKIILSKKDDQLILSTSKLQSNKKISKIKAKINHSLFFDGIKNNVPTSVIHKMIEQYSYDIDFQRDIHSDDSFEVLFEEYYDDKSRKVKDGKLIYAALNVGKKSYKMYFYKDGFYNEKGQDIRKALLKTPVDGARITSRFGMRKHPVLGYTRSHQGVDFGVPIGTPIYAAGDGNIVFAGWKGGYGNYVVIRHNAEYSTAYGHLSRFKVRVGVKVRQRQIIGYSGKTGLASGPHLHFELIHRGAKINPSKKTIQSNRTLGGKDLNEFKNITKQINQQMNG